MKTKLPPLLDQIDILDSEEERLEAFVSADSMKRELVKFTLDSLDEHIRHAIAEKRLLEIRYKGAVRLAEPHDYGVIDGTERLLVFQLRGPDSGKGARRLALA